MRGSDGQIVRTSAGRISFIAEGSSDRCLLLLHGSSFSKEIFYPLMQQPCLAEIRRVAIDLPGHGNSDDASDPARTYTVPGFAAVVREVVAELCLEGCVILGWSLGGEIAMEFLGGEPIVSGVALVSAPPVPAGILGKLRGYTLTGALLARKPRFSPAQALRFERQCIDASSDGRFVEALRRTDPHMRPELAKAAFIISGKVQRDAVQSTDLPVWIVAGEADPLLRIAYVRQLRARSIYGGAPWIVPDAGHAPFLDRVDEFAGRLSDFVHLAVDGNSGPFR